MSTLNWIVCVFASWQIVETLRHGSIFRPLRQWANANRDHVHGEVALLAQLLSCPFCLSHWAPWVPLLVCLYGPEWLMLPVYVLAITRLTQLGNDLSHSFSRSPSPDDEIVVDEREA